MSENFGDPRGIFDGGDDCQGAAKVGIMFNLSHILGLYPSAVGVIVRKQRYS